jgi:hypothetical protein
MFIASPLHILYSYLSLLKFSEPKSSLHKDRYILREPRNGGKLRREWGPGTERTVGMILANKNLG